VIFVEISTNFFNLFKSQFEYNQIIELLIAGQFQAEFTHEFLNPKSNFIHDFKVQNHIQYGSVKNHFFNSFLSSFSNNISSQLLFIKAKLVNIIFSVSSEIREYLNNIF
jgi:hypothetical protein